MMQQLVQVIFGTVLAVCFLWIPANTQQTIGPCSQGLQNELPDTCFNANGVDYNGFLNVITSNRTGKLPEGVTYQQFLRSMCQPATLDKTIPCFLKTIQKWNKTSCTDQDRQIMISRGGQIFAAMENICGDPCEATNMQTMIQCFAAVQVDPSPILSPNASIISDKFPFVGNDTQSVTKFCNSRQRLFSCLSPIGNECPKILEKLYVLGIDFAGMEIATKALCDNPKAYLDGLTCFQKGSPALTQCEQQIQLALTAVQEARFITGETVPSAFQGRLCEAKLSKVDCELKSYAQSCGDSLTALRSTFECASMPRPCKEGQTTGSVYKSLCSAVTTPAPTTVRPTAGPISIRDAGNRGSVDSGVAVVAASVHILTGAMALALSSFL